MNRNELKEMFVDILKKIEDIAYDIKNIIVRLMDVMQEINQYNTLTLTKFDDSI